MRKANKNPNTLTLKESREIIKSVLSSPETYAVCLKDDNRAIGSVGLISANRAIWI